MDERSTAPDQATLFPKSTGDKLREAREAQGLTLADIASTHARADAPPGGDRERPIMAGMPSPTYAIGFAKAYARAVGLDEKSDRGGGAQQPRHCRWRRVTELRSVSAARRQAAAVARAWPMVAGAIGVLVC